jgi:hypothetical protein
MTQLNSILQTLEQEIETLQVQVGVINDALTHLERKGSLANFDKLTSHELHRAAILSRLEKLRLAIRDLII